MTPGEFWSAISERMRRNKERAERAPGQASKKEKEDILNEFEAMQAEMMARGRA